MEYESSSECSYAECNCNCSNCRLGEQEFQRSNKRASLPSYVKVNKGPSQHYNVDVTEKKLFFEHLQPSEIRRISPRSRIEREDRVQQRMERSRHDSWRSDEEGDEQECCCVTHKTKLPYRGVAVHDPQLESEPSPRYGYQAKPPEYRPRRCYRNPLPAEVTSGRYRKQPVPKIRSQRCYTEPSPKLRSHRCCTEPPSEIQSQRYYKNPVPVRETRPQATVPVQHEPYRSRPATTFRQHCEPHNYNYNISVEPQRGELDRDYREESYIDQERRHRATPTEVVNHPRHKYRERVRDRNYFTDEEYSPRAEETDTRYQSIKYQRKHETPLRQERLYEKQQGARLHEKKQQVVRLYEKNQHDARLHEKNQQDMRTLEYQRFQKPKTNTHITYYSKKKYASDEEASPRLQNQYPVYKATTSLVNGKQRNSTPRYRAESPPSDSPSPRRDNIYPEPDYPPPILAVDPPKPKPDPDLTPFRKPKVNQEAVNPKKMTPEERQALYESLKREEYYTPPSSAHSSMTRLKKLHVVQEMVPKWDLCHKRFQEDEEASRPTFTTIKQIQTHRRTALLDLKRTEEIDVAKVEKRETPVNVETHHSSSREYNTSDGTSWATKSSKANELPTIEDHSDTEIEGPVRPTATTAAETSLNSKSVELEANVTHREIKQNVIETTAATPEIEDDEYRTANGTESDDSESIVDISEMPEKMSETDSVKSMNGSEKEYRCDVTENHERGTNMSGVGSFKSNVTTTKEYKCDTETENASKNTKAATETTKREVSILKQGKSRSENPGGSIAGYRGSRNRNRFSKSGPASVPDGLHPLTPKRSLFIPLLTSKAKDKTVQDNDRQSTTVKQQTTTTTGKEVNFWESWWYKSSAPIPEHSEEPELKPLSPPGSSFDSEDDSAGSTQYAMTLDRSAVGVTAKTEETLRRLSADYDVIVKGSGEPQSLDVQDSKLQFNRSHSALQRASQTDLISNDLAPVLELPLRCPHCNKLIESAELVDSISSHGQTWHRPCFQCSVCGKRLYPSNHAVHEGRLYCVVHFAEKIKAPRCQGCGQYILDKVYTQARGNKAWHKNCFRCSRCNEPIVDAKFVALRSGKILCIPCHKHLYKRKCETCGKLIKPTERYVHLKSSGHYWHATPTCLKCAYCQQPLDGRKRVFFKHNKTYCNLACARQDILPNG